MGRQIDFGQALTKPPRWRWTREEAEAVLAAWRESGLSMSAYARKQGVKVQRLSWWRRRLDDGGQVGEGVRFIPAVVQGRAPAVIVHLPDGIAIETTDVALLPATWVAEVVGALERER